MRWTLLSAAMILVGCRSGASSPPPASAGTAGADKPAARVADAACVDVCKAGTSMLQTKQPPQVANCDQLKGGLLGKITADGKDPVGGVSILVRSSCGAFTATTSPKGTFEVPSLPAGPYLLEAKLGREAAASGYVEVEPATVHTTELEMRGDDVARAREGNAKRERCGCGGG